jgi:hypothetical protein
MSLTPKDPLFRYPIDNTKFWLWEAEEGEGWTVGSGDHEIAFRLPESTARLIAAAPELLAACKQLHNCLSDWVEIADSDDLRDSDSEAIQLSIAAIAKAEGRSA